MKVVIVCGGQAPSKELFEKEITKETIIICADSGANALYEHNIIPHYLVGDFDSIKPEILLYYKTLNINIETYPIEKDYTDSELALNKAFEIGATEIVLLGCTGTRLDHVFGNMGLLKRCIDANIKGTIIDEYNKIFLINKSTELYGEYDQTFSLQCFGDRVKNLTIKNGKYPLNNYDLFIGDPITISNKFLHSPVNILFEEGLLLAFYTRD